VDGYGTSVHWCESCGLFLVLGRSAEGLVSTLEHSGCLTCGEPLVNASAYHAVCGICHEQRGEYVPPHKPRRYGERGRFCTGCGKFKAFDQFWRQTSLASGYAPECRDCKERHA
jgi:hypothetical protein